LIIDVEALRPLGASFCRGQRRASTKKEKRKGRGGVKKNEHIFFGAHTGTQSQGKKKKKGGGIYTGT